MRLGIDARFFGPQETGIGRYVERLISHLEQIDQVNEYVLLLQPKAWDLWQPKNARWTKRLAPERWYSLAEQVRMPARYRAARVDLWHIPHFNVPLFWNGPFVVTIHDLILNQFPTERASTLGPFLFRAKFLAYEATIRHAINQAAQVITVSSHSRQEILKRFPVSSDRVSVTYESVDPLPDPSEWSSVSERGIQTPYLLYVGNSYPHKNLERFLEGVELAQRRGENFQVVLVGKRDYFSLRLERLVKERGMKNILFYGFASDQELAALYQHAQAYFFPSLSEGFGLPGLEAMSMGTPVFAARASCLPEVFGSAASYFDPLDPTSIAQSISQALHDTLERQRLIAAGTARVQEFSWRRMAEETLALYTSTHAQLTSKKRS